MTIYPEVSAFIIEKGVTEDVGYTNSSLLFIGTALAGLIGCLYLIQGKERILTHVDSDEEFPSQSDSSDHNLHDYDQLALKDGVSSRPRLE